MNKGRASIKAIIAIAAFLWLVMVAYSIASTNFPTALDSYTDVQTGDTIQASHLNNPCDAIEALEAKVGIDSSSETDSHDYKIDILESASTRHSTGIATNASNISTNTDNLIVGDGTSGRTLRSGTLALSDGTDADTAKASFGSTQYAYFNTDTITSTDNIDESTSWTGNFRIYDDGAHPEYYAFCVSSSGLSGQAAGVLSANVIYNSTSTSGIVVSPIATGGHITLYIYAPDGEQITDLPTLLDSGNLRVHITYLTTE